MPSFNQDYLYSRMSFPCPTHAGGLCKCSSSRDQALLTLHSLAHSDTRSAQTHLYISGASQLEKSALNIDFFRVDAAFPADPKISRSKFRSSIIFYRTESLNVCLYSLNACIPCLAIFCTCIF